MKIWYLGKGQFSTMKDNEAGVSTSDKRLNYSGNDSLYIILRLKFDPYRAVFKWLSKVITWLRLLRLVIGLKGSRQFFNQWEAKPKPKPIAPCTRGFSRASSELQVIARNCDWSMELFVPVVIGRSNCFGFGFSTVIWKPFYGLQLIPNFCVSLPHRFWITGFLQIKPFIPLKETTEAVFYTHVALWAESGECLKKIFVSTALHWNYCRVN